MPQLLQWRCLRREPPIAMQPVSRGWSETSTMTEATGTDRRTNGGNPVPAAKKRRSVANARLKNRAVHRNKSAVFISLLTSSESFSTAGATAYDDFVINYSAAVYSAHGLKSDRGGQRHDVTARLWPRQLVIRARDATLMNGSGNEMRQGYRYISVESPGDDVVRREPHAVVAGDVGSYVEIETVS